MPEATVVIATRDRREELRRALHSTLAQRGDLEIVVIDDGSSDGSSEMVASEFPQVRLERSDEALGQAAQRNRGTLLATAPVVVAIDDDAVFVDSKTVVETLQDFGHPRVGVVGIPFVDVRHGDAVLQRAPDGEGIYLDAAFVGAAYATRRDTFLAVGGFREELRGYWEEMDLATRMLEAGYVVRLGRATPLEHHESPRRDSHRQLRMAWRNAIVVAILNVPSPSLPGHLAWLTANCLVTAVQRRRPRPIVTGLLAGYRDGWRLRSLRAPVAREVFKLRQRMWRDPRRLRIDEAEPSLPPLPD